MKTQIERTELKKIIVDDCWFEWQLADGTRIDDPYKAFDEKKDVFAVVLHAKGIVFREHRTYCHIDDAWKILRGGRFGKWKTAELLVNLRQGLRERFAQGMALDIPAAGISQAALKKWFVIARHYDAIHHGEATF